MLKTFSAAVTEKARRRAALAERWRHKPAPLSEAGHVERFGSRTGPALRGRDEAQGVYNRLAEHPKASAHAGSTMSMSVSPPACSGFTPLIG